MDYFDHIYLFCIFRLLSLLRPGKPSKPANKQVRVETYKFNVQQEVWLNAGFWTCNLFVRSQFPAFFPSILSTQNPLTKPANEHAGPVLNLMCGNIIGKPTIIKCIRSGVWWVLCVPVPFADLPNACVHLPRQESRAMNRSKALFSFLSAKHPVASDEVMNCRPAAVFQRCLLCDNAPKKQNKVWI